MSKSKWVFSFLSDLLHHGVLEGIAQAEGAVAVHVVVHPLVHRRGLFGDRFQRGMRMEQGERGGKAVVGDAEDADAAVVVGYVLDEPVDGVIGVGGFVVPP